MDYKRLIVVTKALYGGDAGKNREGGAMKDHKVAPKQRWARFRLLVIGPLLASPAASGDLQSAIRDLTERIYQHPLRSKETMKLGFSTVERWYYQAKGVDDPIVALSRKVRSDAGRRVAVSEMLLAALKAQYTQHPRWTVQLHYDNLTAEVAENPVLGKLPSYQSVRRMMREKGWERLRVPANPTNGQRRAALRRESHEIRGYEVSHVHALWHLDFHEGSLKILDDEGAWQTPMVCAILDDRSRLCCHLQWFLAETSQNLIHALIQAILKRGLPRSLMTDNGSAMLAEETTEGLARIGVSHETTLPFSPYQNGKQEVFWAQLEGRLLELMRGAEEPLRLEFLNRASQAWVELDYHRRTHSEIGCTPLNRIIAGPEVSRKAPDMESLQQAFTRKVTRTQRRGDGTVTVDGVRFEVPSRFRNLPRLTLRYVRWDHSRLLLMDPKKDILLAQLLPQDKERNASGERRTLEPVATSQVQTPAKSKEMPALLRKWLEDYAATGLPPAYLPSKEERDDR
jgi:putative transposase